MDGDMGDLGRRAVACKGWRWMRGMLCLADEDGYASRIISVGLSGRTSETADAYVDGGIICRSFIKDDALPDLTDPSTLGCLLALVREAWSNPDLHFRPATAPPDMGGDKRWLVCDSRWAFMGSKTEAEAIVRALESKGKR